MKEVIINQEQAELFQTYLFSNFSEMLEDGRKEELAAIQKTHDSLSEQLGQPKENLKIKLKEFLKQRFHNSDGTKKHCSGCNNYLEFCDCPHF